MASEAVHSLTDTGNEILLLYGLRRAARPPDELHPLGHGRELYFWSFIVTILIFGLGAGVSLYQGIRHVAAPERMTHVVDAEPLKALYARDGPGHDNCPPRRASVAGLSAL